MDRTFHQTFENYTVIGPMNLPSRIAGNKIFKLSLFVFGSRNKYYALEMGNVRKKTDVMVRIDSKCVYAHIFGSARCDCREQLHKAMELIAQRGEGLLIYAYDQDGRGITLEEHVKVYMLQDLGFDTVDANLEIGLKDDQRNYREALDILHHYEIKGMKLLTNNPRRIEFFSSSGIKTERVHHEAAKLDDYNMAQLAVKKTKLGHLFGFDVSEKDIKKALDFQKTLK